MERLRNRDGVERSVCERQRFGSSGHGEHAGHGSAEDCAHLVNRLDRDEGRTVRCDQAGELPGAGRDVGDDAAGRDAQRLREPRDRIRRVRGTAALVRFGLAAETGDRDFVDGQLGCDGVQPWRPHSSLPEPAHRPARGSSPSATGCVHGQQPIDG